MKSKDETQLLRRALDVIRGVREGIGYAEEYYIGDVAGTAEVLSFFNGYAGSPNIDALERDIQLYLSQEVDNS